MPEEGVIIKNYLYIYALAIALIIGVALMATDEPDISALQPRKIYLKNLAQLNVGPSQLPGRLPNTNDPAGPNLEYTRLIKYSGSGDGPEPGEWKERRRVQLAAGSNLTGPPAKHSQLREVTAYNVGDPDQNYGDPCESANGEDICAALDSGFRRCAANFVPFGTVLHIAHFGVCTVTDRMHRRYSDRVDIAMKKHEKQRALEFGRRRLKVTIVATREG